MHKVEKRILLALPIACAAIFFATSSDAAKKEPRLDDPRSLLKREELMVINLNRGPKSTGFYILTSLKSVRAMQRDLDKGARQLEQVDAAYAKASGRPDDRTLGTTLDGIKQAQKTADLLEKQLDGCFNELKADVKTTLIKNQR